MALGHRPSGSTVPPQPPWPRAGQRAVSGAPQTHEDNKHEPGAADFCYDEMEMRRHASSTPWGERVILGAYWLTAGYGLRGLHALGALFQYLGFDHARPTL
jgi:hypothetical protein